MLYRYNLSPFFCSHANTLKKNGRYEVSLHVVMWFHCTRSSAATAASRLGLNSHACGLSIVAVPWSPSLSQDSSRGYKCCTGRSTHLRPVRSLAPRTTPTLPTFSYPTMPCGQIFLFRSGNLTITTSPTAKVLCLFPCLRQ